MVDVGAFGGEFRKRVELIRGWPAPQLLIHMV
jgi:hypothetical protein